ncbi:MAG: hypothetical protein EZS28_001729 [Streblomastix strix]|uniref:SPRY domain-containing protein n=1 Tax=Streblomastix strix TaxID=222440 RepID=A0A5J4X6D9_9EUKA|nr:MAG: hypothetical protein EZS28_001729 [Streblomastix strix]
MFITLKFKSVFRTHVIATSTLVLIVLVLSLIVCLGLSQRSIFCSVGWCSVCKNFPFSSPVTRQLQQVHLMQISVIRSSQTVTALTVPVSLDSLSSFENSLPIDSIPHTAQVPSLEDTKVDEETYTMTNGQSTILFDPVIKKGIVKFEVQSLHNLMELGTAEESVRYGRNEEPYANALLGGGKIVRYNWMGNISHIGDSIQGNAEFHTGDRVALELNMDSNLRTLTFFVNDVEQPIFLINIPAAVRAYLFQKDQAFEVLKFEAISEPTAKHAKGTRAFVYGTEWKMSEEKKCAIQ